MRFGTDRCVVIVNSIEEILCKMVLKLYNYTWSHGMRFTMTDEQIIELGLQELGQIDPETDHTEKWKTKLMDYQFNHEYPDDSYIWLTNVMALRAVDCGSFGIGCVLTDGSGNVVVHGHNEIFNPYFRSDRHGEMVVMDKFEDTCRGLIELGGYTLYSSLEPCPMCLVRLISSTVDKVFYAAPDISGGMVHVMKNLPPFWTELGEGMVFSQAKCSRELIRSANDIFLLNAYELIEKLKNIREHI